MGRCLALTYRCFGCRNNGNLMRDFPILKAKGKETNQALHDGMDTNGQNKNRLYMLQANEGANP